MSPFGALASRSAVLGGSPLLLAYLEFLRQPPSGPAGPVVVRVLDLDEAMARARSRELEPIDVA